MAAALDPLPEPLLRHIGAGDRWQLAEDCAIPLGDGVTLTVPAGMVYDLASIPRLGIVQWIVGEDDCLSTLAPLAHDVLYSHAGAVPVEWLSPYYRRYSRAEADEILRVLAVRQGVRPWRARIVYWGVRAFAAAAWKD